MSERSSLEEITIRGLGVIDSATFEVGRGLTVLTGETGAGKTMVLTALSLILGAKSDSDLVRQGEERTTVTGRFALSDQLLARVIDDGADVDDHEVIITRTVSAQGKSRILLGGVPSTTHQISELADELIEIHAQSSTARLMKPNVQREMLDSFAEVAPLLLEYQNAYQQYGQMLTRIKELRSLLSKRDQEISLLNDFLAAFAAVNPLPGEPDEIENEISKLGSVELLHGEISRALILLEDEDTSIFNLMQEARKSLELVRGKDQRLDEIIDRYLDVLFNAQDVAGDLASYVTNLEADPVRFEFLQQRKSAINALLKKYGIGSDRQAAYDALILQAADAQAKLDDLSGGDDRLAEMERDLHILFLHVKKSAQNLSNARRSSALSFSGLVTAELAFLSMPHARVEVECLTSNGEVFADYSPTGLDEVRFLFSAHAGGQLLPLAKVASGGEMSRVMLALEVVLAEKSPVGTYIFDEVDAGVGGKAAVEVGRRLAKLSQSAQVIVVTHLAQVAVWAENHLVVRKNESGLVTQSDIQSVSGTNRETEIARMLSGQEESQTAREHAAELLNLVAQSMIS